MRGVFDDEEIEPVRQSSDTELTLGTGALLALAGGLVLLCCVFFGIGYATGHVNSVPAPVRQPQAAPDQEPLQSSGSIPKPSAVAQAPMPQAQGDADQSAASESVATSNGAALTVPAGAAQFEIHPAMAAADAAQGATNGAAQLVHPALPQPQTPEFMVQIAAVSNSVDAEVLADALKKRNYPVVSKREPADNFIHVRIGPFASRQLADQWKTKLLNDGYNAQVQP